MQLTPEQLAARLNVTVEEVREWIAAGLPTSEEGTLDPHVVRNWLIDNGKVRLSESAGAGSESPTIFRTRSELANYLGISVRTIAEWLTDPSFPGKSGSPGRRDGYFPLETIEAWWAAKQGATPDVASGESPRDRLTRIRADQAALDLAEQQGKLIDVHEVQRFLTRTIAATRAVLDALPDRVEAVLPTELDAEAKSRVRDSARSILDDAYAMLSELASGDADEVHDDDE